MIRTAVLLFMLLAAAWWYLDGRRHLSAEIVRSAYAERLAAVRRFDAEWLCEHLAEDFASVAVTSTPDGPVRHELDRGAACTAARRTMRAMKHASDASAQVLAPTIAQEIDVLELAPDHRSAYVHSRLTLQLADMTLMHAEQDERLVRRGGRILSLGGHSRSWVYLGDGQ